MIKSQKNKVELEEAFIDDRGKIQNILFETIKSVAIITSKEGTERSNHWHRKNGHYLYVLSGSMLYMERDLDGNNMKAFMVWSEEMVYTGPNKVHKTLFDEDTVLLSLSHGIKKHKEHEKDVVRCEF
jgi:oxalate decarboxylase/phosphoglucose isomerase-like protein (cupin superfamily)